MSRSLAMLVAITCAFFAAPVGAAELKVISAGAVRGLIAGMIQDYSRKTGQTFDFTVGTTGQLRAAIETGKPADLIIVSTPLMAELEKTGKLTPGSRTELGRVGLGVAVRDGAPAPDIATADGFKKAVLDARSVAYTDPAEGGTSGIDFTRITQQLGIADVVKGKAILTKGGRETSEAVAKGEAELGVLFISEIIPVKGAKVAGLLPEPLLTYSAYATAIPVSSTGPAAARAFIAALAGTEMAARWKEAGFEPPK
jgi:molybdate transport system substrate-binding protein